MRRTALLAVALAAMLALAGCGGTSGTTTAPTTNTTTTQASVDYPPGVSADGVESGFELTGAHAETLRTADYTVTEITSIRVNGSGYKAYMQTTKAAGDTMSASRSYSATPSGNNVSSAEFWANASTGVIQYTHDDGNTTTTTVGSAGDTDLVRTPDQWSESLYTLVASGQLEVSETDEGNFALRASGPLNVTTDYGEVTTETLTATVTPNGFVTDISVSYTTTINGETATVSKQFAFERGDVTVTKPTWA
ncbi:hypothetical protein U3A55_01400 [Salarchaeum sp. III]|uniref:hypothetical protein n=1 Tax=Salarchaeum sp. III TaxID=3107927 RepID=UPI002EDA59B9